MASEKKLSFYLEGAGLQPVFNDVKITEPLLQIWNAENRSWQSSALFTQPIKNTPPLSPLKILYFWSQDCEPCLSDMGDFQTFASKNLVSFQVLFVHEGEMQPPELEAYLKAFPKLPLALEPEGVLAERAAILGSPGVILIDQTLQILAHNNGPIDFLSPGFELFNARLRQIQILSHQNMAKNSPSFRAQLLSEVNDHSDQRVRILGIPWLSWGFILLLAILCYTLIKSFRNAPSKK
jgi:thiol-disulfide isomerase/thioredoxin